MRLVTLVTAGWLGGACASSRTAVVVTPTPATIAAPASTAGGGRTQEFDAPTEGNELLHVDELPPAFAQLSPRDRERWHACHIFFLRAPGRHPASMDEPMGNGPRNIFRRSPRLLVFGVRVTEYVDTPEAERRTFLIRHGCPDSLVDLADGTHLDIIER